MVDAVQVWPPGARFIDSSGNILAGGSIEFYLAGTTDPKTVHSDSDLSTALGSIVYLDAGGAPVTEQGGSTKTTVYVGTDPYKVVVKNADGVVQETKDDLAGAFNSAAILETLVLIPETEVETLTTDKTLTSDDIGQLKNMNTTGGAFTVTLPDATGLNNGARFGFRMAGTANQAKIKTTGTQTIGGAGVTSTALSLTKLGETIWLVNDGGNWLIDTYVPPLFTTMGVIAITDRLTTPPGSELPGARYIMSGSPSGDWSGFAQHDIVEADGQGGWRRFTPVEDCGWIAYVADENAYYFFVDTAWTLLGATDTTPGFIELAVQSEMETGTDVVRAVTPGRQHFHPSHPKAWFAYNQTGTPAIITDQGVASISDDNTGRFTVTFDTAFSATTAYSCTGTYARGSGDSEAHIMTLGSGQTGTKTTTQFAMWAANVSANQHDVAEDSAQFSGDQ